MKFINERISKEDRNIYDLEEIENSVPKGVWHPERDWTVDKERKIYLRQMWRSNLGAEPERDPKFIDIKYHFFVDNMIYEVNIRDDLEKEIKTNEGFLKSVLTVTSVKPIKNDHDDFGQYIKILYEALWVRKGTGIYSSWIKEHDLTLIYNNKEIKGKII